jgi:hypothetical protein
MYCSCAFHLADVLKLCIREQRNHGLKCESDCVSIGIGVKRFMNRGKFARDSFVEFLSFALQLNGNILSVLDQVFIPAVSHMKIANVKARENIVQLQKQFTTDKLNVQLQNT